MTRNLDSLSPATFTAAAVVGLLVLHVVRKFFKARCPLQAIPSVGVPSYPFGFYVGAWNYMKHGRAITEEGYLKYPGRAFKVALANRWLVLLNGRTLIEDIRTAPAEYLSGSAAVNSVLHLEHTMGHEQFHDPYQIPVIKAPMTRNIGVCFPDIRNEVVAAFEDLVPAKTDEWISVPAMQTAFPLLSRVTNRFFIGLPCRDPDYIKITTEFTLNVTRDAIWLHTIPSILRPIAARLFGHLEPATRGAMKVLGPILEHRLEMDDKYGPEWPNGDRPNDMISWLLDEARGHPKRRTVRQLTRQVLNVNFGALHTTTQAIIFDLSRGGWTKAAMGKMVKLDSFFKESSRIMPLVVAGVVRQVLKDFTFSDGSTVPAGTLVGIPVLAEHHDEANYPGGCEFDPFRFSRMREQAGQGTKHQMVSLSADFLSFGIGRHACPGRFFAADVQKLLLAHVIFTYDLKFKDGLRPVDEWMALMSSPNKTAEIMFRRRT
ncbi:Cytochrome p450 [Mycena venus]|uniref:Cytochrome p450 n=1 Tax=Mycena venus TaxID=2733690 RepID=A0A8H6YI53_9AGAR|nr:Cytochrome p450 [Mycena venus]